MQKIITLKQFVTILLSIFILNGCSFSSPSVKYGTYIGAGSGAVFGAIIGSELGGTHMGGGSSKAEAAVTVGLLFATLGALFGAGTGYAIDAIISDDKKIKEIQESHALIEDK